MLAGEEWVVAEEVARMLDDRQAACRQAELIQSRLFPLSERVGDDNDDVAMIYMWAGFIRNRSCNAPVGDPEL